MSDLDLYRLIFRCCNEYHEDGIFFVPPWSIKDFTTGLCIKDSEDAIPATITTNGYLAVDTHDFEGRFDEDIEAIITKLFVDINEK